MADVSIYKTELEQKIRQTTHIPIRIGQLRTRMRGFSPGIILQNISVDTTDTAAKPAIKLKEVRLSIDLLQWLVTGDLLAASWVTLVGAEFDVIRNQEGRIAIKGLQSKDDEPPLWLLQGNKYQILQSDISWQDLKTNGKQVRFHNFDLLIKNHEQNHEIHLLTSLPEQYGQSVRISALLQGNVFETDRLEGKIYIEGINLHGPALAAGVLPPDFKIESGSGDLRLWSDWKNASPYRIAGYVQAQQIKIGNSAGKALFLDTLEGNLSWLEKQRSWRLGIYDVNIVADHQHWQDGEVYLQQDIHGNWSGLLKQLDLSALMHIAPIFLSADSESGNWLHLNPRGRLSDFTVYLQADRQRYALQGDFNQLGIDNLKSLPGIQGLTGQINGTDSRGRIEFASENVLLDASDLFRDVLTVKQLRGGIIWRQQAEFWQFSSRNLAIDSPDFQTETDFDLIVPKTQKSTKLDMLTRFGNFKDISRVPDYLPAKIMSKEAVNWLDRAFVAGQISQGELLIHGNLDQFPFTNGQGRFDTLFSIEHGEIKFNPDWPNLREVNADVHFLGEDLQVAIAKGSSENVDVNQALVRIFSLPNSSNQVDIKGELHGKIQNALLYLQKTPLHMHVDQLLKILDFESTTRVDLDLKIPYNEKDLVKAKVTSHLDNARLTLRPIDLKINNINGVLNFTEERVNSERLSAATLGYPIQAALNSDSIATHLKIDGTTNMDNLHRQFAFLDQDIGNGVFTYQAELTMPNAVNQTKTLTINSNLQGVAIDGQDFFRKTAEEQRAFSLNFQLDGKTLLPLQVHYGNELNAALLINTDQNRLYSGQVILG